MRNKVYILLTLLIFALLIQNTCPQGLAGKSSVVSQCSHCPYKQQHRPAPTGGETGILSHATSHPPLFVLDIPDTRPTFGLAALATPKPVIPNAYKNAAPEELLQPPRA